MQLADFNDPDEPPRWQPINDVVMGGRSTSEMLVGNRCGAFIGTLSLANGGGFSLVRRRDQLVDLSALGAIELRHFRGRPALGLLDSAQVQPRVISDRQAGPFRLERFTNTAAS